MKTGQEVEAEFIYSNQKRAQLVARIDGKVAFISKENDEHIEPGSTWVCRIEENKNNYMVLLPLVIWRTPEQNEEIAQEKLKELKEKFEAKL